MKGYFLFCYNHLMNRAEFGNRIANFVFGKKVEGVVSTPLQNPREDSSRYAVKTEDGILDVLVPTVESHAVFSPFASYVLHPPLERGSQINQRLYVVREWIDGQINY